MMFALLEDASEMLVKVMDLVNKQLVTPVFSPFFSSIKGNYSYLYCSMGYQYWPLQ